MPLHIRRISDRAAEATWIAILREAGYNPEPDGSILHLRGVGVSHGDQSVDLQVELLDIDGHRILSLRAPLRTPTASHAVAALACLRGNDHCHLASIIPRETSSPDPTRRFRLEARYHLFADHLSADELRVMLYLFLKELDEIDNELTLIMTGQ